MLGNFEVAGAMDVSGCTSLEYLSCRSVLLTSMNVSGCTRLAYLTCADCKLASINASGCSALYDIYCANNVLTSINVSGCTGLVSLDCMENKLTSIDLSDCSSLDSFSCEGNRFKSIDLSHCPRISFNKLRAEGEGYVAMFGTTYSDDQCKACAESIYDAPFLGWYSSSGVKISEERELPENATSYTDIVARFGSPEYVPGDANNDLTVNTEDALLVLRAALGLIQFDYATTNKCDMDYSGSIDTTDALLILRIALDIN